MAGGSGTRLWPVSRNDQPKQLIKLVQGKSLLQLSYERLRGMFQPEEIFVCTAEAQGPAVLENLPELPKANLMGEPQPRDTANAVGFSAAILAKKDPDAVCAIVTADHVIEPAAVFQASLRKAFEEVATSPQTLVTFGIVPSFGHTGLGYIHRGEALPIPGVYRVQAFKEKPDKATADRYVESGRYYWNSGMFVWKCSTVLAELAAHLPESHSGMLKIQNAWGTKEQHAVIESVYPKLPRISIDFAVMEPASQAKGKAHVAVVELPVQWLDVGSWPALAETMTMDDHNNAVAAPCFVFLDSDDNVIMTQEPHHLITTIGVSDMIIVHTKDATLVCPKNDAQRVKELLVKVKEKFGAKYL